MRPKTLHASLQAALAGLHFPVRAPEPSAEATPVAAVLAGNVPVLAPQVLLPTLLRRRGALIKPASAAPSFTERFVARLQERIVLPEPAFLTRRWRGGTRDDEELVHCFDRIAVYGGSESIKRFADLRRSCDQLVLFGPKSSVAVLWSETPPDLDGVARDVALFEQRGCLSVRVAYLVAPHTDAPSAIAAALSRALDRTASQLPPSGNLADASAARQWLDLARLSGQPAFGVPGRSGVVVDDPSADRPPPGRSVSVRAVSRDELLTQLNERREHIQGLAWTGIDAPPTALMELATRAAWRVAPAGRLQETDADWHNDGIDLLHWLR